MFQEKKEGHGRNERSFSAAVCGLQTDLQTVHKLWSNFSRDDPSISSHVMAVLQNNSYLKRAWGPVQDISTFQSEGLEINLNKCRQGHGE